jgi:hypothetical protein
MRKSLQVLKEYQNQGLRVYANTQEKPKVLGGTWNRHHFNK